MHISLSGTDSAACNQGLDTHHPELLLSDGQCLIGEYQESLGSQIFLKEITSTANDGEENAEAADPTMLGLTTKVIKFKEKSLQPASMGSKPSS